MVDEGTRDLMVAISVIALLVFISALRKTVRRGEWSRTAALAAAIPICTQASINVIVTYRGEWKRVTNVYLNMPWEWPGHWHLVWRALSLLLGVIAVAVFLVRVRRGNVPVNGPAVLLVVVALISFGSSLLHGDNPFRPVSVVFVVLLAACTVAPRGLGIHVGIATWASIIAITSGFTFLEFIQQHGFGVMPCTEDKCGILNFDFSGVMEYDNALAVYLALAMPFVYIGFGSWEGVTLSAYILWLILITGSRSGSVAAVITFVALVLLRPNIRRPVAAPIRSWLLHFGLTAALIVGIAVPFTENDPAAYTGRAYLWSLAWRTLSDPADMWYGTGVRSLLRMHESGQLVYPVYSVHNQWLQVVLSTGLIGFVLFLTALALLLRNARGAYSLVAGCALLPAFVLAVTERPWPIDSLELLVWTVPAALLSYPVIKRRAKPLGSSPIRTFEPGAYAESAAEQRPGDTLSVGSGD
ncbi:O-antigen ligase family protein [Mycobacterium malmoense]|uniref:O-antigen ligase family protein n=1 Tax=Mycobacterium malmoense TaxID=1780 RepID=UPI0008F84BE1|nr:O-antigen ligase family protein [Mycobacterium malmoense]OIN80655.1 hypothetical protein BMG05_11670 [Mycobacterium malmoense]